MKKEVSTFRNYISELKDERLIEILNIEYKDYTDDALKIVQEELISRGFSDVSIDKEKKTYKFRDLILQVKFEDVQHILRKEFFVNKELEEKYREVFTQLFVISPSEIDNINIFVDKQYDELTNTTSDWDVFGYEVDTNDKFSVDLYYWSDWLSFNVKSDNLNRVGKELFVACCLLKMTVHGFSTEEIENRLDDIISNSNEVNYSDYSIESPEEDTYDVHPWLRYWARTIDILLFATISGYLLLVVPKSVWMIIGRIEYIMPIPLFLWVLVEAALLSTWGTTPGKFLLGISIRDSEGNKLNFSSALNRSASVWLWGMGCGIVVIELIANVSSYKRLSDKGVTRWDQNGKYSISHNEISILSIIIAIMILVVIPMLRYFKVI